MLHNVTKNFYIFFCALKTQVFCVLLKCSPTRVQTTVVKYRCRIMQFLHKDKDMLNTLLDRLCGGSMKCTVENIERSTYFMK